VISIQAFHIGQDLVLQVHDPGEVTLDATTREGFGVGLGQIRERLQQMYGEAASVDLSSLAGDGTTVTIRLPLAPDAAPV
jgi:two-component system, LytTR family, sensor kinase